MTAIRHYTNTLHGTAVEAVQLSKENADEVVAWCHGLRVVEEDPQTGLTYAGINVTTENGNKRLSEGQWLVRTDKGFHIFGQQAFHYSFDLA